MGRSYWFECSKCGYRARVAGRADRGLNYAVQTILCHDCKELFDAVTRLRVANEARFGLGQGMRSYPKPPPFQALVNRLPQLTMNQFKWLQFKLQCPAFSHHRVQSWSEPGKCPRCGVFLDKHALPYRIWE